MNIVLGPCHPQLETALAEEVRSYDPLAPLLLVVPSETLSRRVKVLLAKEHGLHLLNVHIRTFFQLGLDLFHEVHGSAEPVLRGETFMEEALRQVVPAHGRFARIMDNDSACAALWQSLRDLKDGMLEPESALEALREGLFDNRDRAALGDLFELYREVKRRFPEWQAQDRQDLAAAAARYAPVSAHLGRFQHICYYGFYDLTQSQLELFRTIAGNYPMTLFYPLVQGDPDWSFARDFYDRYLRGLAGTGEVVDLAGNGTATGISPGDTSPGPPVDPRPRPEIVSCAGPGDEVRTVAKNILRLVEQDGFDFQQVGVVARTLGPWLSWFQEIFPEHGIPFHTPAQEPLCRFNRVRGLLTLLDLPVRNYPRADVIDLLASHDFRFENVPDAGTEPRPDLWDMATRSLRITRGMAEWHRLESYLGKGVRLSFVDEEGGGRLLIRADQVAALLKIVDTLHAHLSALPAEGTWSDLAARWQAVVDRFLNHGSDEAAPRVAKAIDQTFAGLAALEAITPTVPLETFARTLRHSLDRATVPLAEEVVPGVQVLDAGSARGIPFRALFLVGMNEGVFPRAVREDPFLRDRARQVLETDLGFKVSSRLSGFDEEKLLFAMLRGSVTDRLLCSYQRADAAERPLAPSWYLRAAAPAADTAIPRSVLGKRGIPPFDNERWLLPEELAVRQALEGADPTPLVRAGGGSVESFRKSAAALCALDDAAGTAGPFDGITGPLEPVWNGIVENAVSATTLEAYGRCPFQYFARNILKLERLERPETAAPVQALEWGELCHEILQRFYQEPDRARGDGWIAWLYSAADEVLSTFEAEGATGYPAAWQAARAELMGVLLEAVEADMSEMEKSGFRPAELESWLTTRLDETWPPDIRGLTVHGRLDRIDRHETAARYRVIDYKYKTGRQPSDMEHRPRDAAVRGRKLQLPVYLLLAREYTGAQGPGADTAVEAAWYYFIARRWSKGPLVRCSFPADAWEEISGAAIRNVIIRRLRGIRAGEFHIKPGSHCRFCEVSEICRKDHFPSLTRAARHEPAGTAPP